MEAVRAAPVTPESTTAPDAEQHVRRAVDRAIARNIPGIPKISREEELGVGQTPKELIYSRETVRLYHYLPLQDEIYRIPLVLVMSPVARGYILDLAKGQSFVEYLLLQGYDVYMIDWAPPHTGQGELGFEEVIRELVHGSVERVVEHSGEPEVTLVGYCMGGMLSAIYTALYPEERVSNLVCFTTPVNSDGMPLFKRWADTDVFDIDRLVGELGVLPADVVSATMRGLRPLAQGASNLRLLNNVDNDAFVKAHLRFDRWASDQLALPGRLASQLTKEFLRDNKLVTGEFRVGGESVDLSRIRVPFLHVTAEYDHIVPGPSSRDLIQMVGSEDKQEIVIRGGHVSLVAGGNAVYRLWPKLDGWLRGRSV